MENQESFIARHQRNFAVLAVAGFFTFLAFSSGIVGFPAVRYIALVPAKKAQINNSSPKIFFSPSRFAVGVTPGPKNLPQTTAIFVDTARIAVSSIDIEIAYNPKSVTNVAVLPVDFSKKPYDRELKLTQGTIDRTRGRISYKLSAVRRNNNIPFPPVVKVADVAFTITRPEKTIFSFLPTTGIYVATTDSNTAEAGNISPQKQILRQVIPAQGF